jgi:hypothetical protein
MMQVWFKGQLKGFLDREPHGSTPTHCIFRDSDYGLGPSDPTNSVNSDFAIARTKRNAKVDRFDLMMRGNDLAGFVAEKHKVDIATCCTETMCNQDAMRLTWEALDAQTPEIYEEIFDMPEFEPL